MAEVRNAVTVPSLPVEGPSAWGSSTFADEARLRKVLPAAACEELVQAVRRHRGVPFTSVAVDTLALPVTTQVMQEVSRELWDGHGLLILAGLPIDGLSVPDCELLYWILGSKMGKPVSQSAAGEHIAHVRDRTRPGEKQAARGYTSRRELPLHTDNGDYMGLFCIRAAKSGGMSLGASIPAVFNTMLRRRPDLLEPLFRGFPYHRKGEQQPGQPDVTEHDVAVLGHVDGRLAGRYVRSSISVAYDALDRQWDDRDKEALDLFDDICWDEDHLIRFSLNPGEIYWANNWTTLHSRTEFEDHEDPERSRLILRIWIQRENPRSQVPLSLRNWENPSGDLGIDPKPGGKPAGAEYLREFKQRTL